MYYTRADVHNRIYGQIKTQAPADSHMLFTAKIENISIHSIIRVLTYRFYAASRIRHFGNLRLSFYRRNYSQLFLNATGRL
jgi:hypothetical protein